MINVDLLNNRLELVKEEVLKNGDVKKTYTKTLTQEEIQRSIDLKKAKIAKLQADVAVDEKLLTDNISNL
jgi:hypothetical protein